MADKGLLSSAVIATKPSGGTSTCRPDIKCSVPGASSGALSVTVKVDASFGLPDRRVKKSTGCGRCHRHLDLQKSHASPSLRGERIAGRCDASLHRIAHGQ